MIVNATPSFTGRGIHVDNVNEALPLGLDLIKHHGVSVVSRGIETLEVYGPVMTTYMTPQRRVLFDPVRDANPFFHLAEALWILSGDSHVNLPALFLKSIVNYSDDGITFDGAYGHRLRRWPTTVGGLALDQVSLAIAMLREKPDTRQAVLSIWNPNLDLATITKDMPCNDMVMLRVRENVLDMTVCNRSNDVIWGAYGANVVQFSMLQEYIAGHLGLQCGPYTQMSNSYHVYPTNPFWQKFIAGEHAPGHVVNPYMNNTVQVWPLIASPEEAPFFDVDLELMRVLSLLNDLTAFTQTSCRWQSSYFQSVFIPMVRGYIEYKNGDYIQALEELANVCADDWRVAMMDWVVRRMNKAQA